MKDPLKVLSHGDDVIGEMRKRIISQTTDTDNDILAKRQSYFIEKLLSDVEEGSSFLDIGCFLGYAYHKLNNEMGKNLDYYGIDIWDEAIQVCKENFKYGKFFKGHGFDLNLYAKELPRKKFDYIWFCQPNAMVSSVKFGLKMAFLRGIRTKKCFIVSPISKVDLDSLNDIKDISMFFPYEYDYEKDDETTFKFEVISF